MTFFVHNDKTCFESIGLFLGYVQMPKSENILTSLTLFNQVSTKKYSQVPK